MFNFRSCCRLCLKQDESVAINCLDSDELCSAVKHFFCFDITSNDDCSTKVCRECTGKITNFLIFKNSVLHTQETIKQYQLFQAKILNIKDEPSDDDDVIFVPPKQVVSFNTKIVRATARKSTTQLLPVVIKPIKLRKLRIICNSLTKNDLKNVVLNKRDQKILKLHTHTNMKSKQNNELKCPPIRLNLNKIFEKYTKNSTNSIKFNNVSPSTSKDNPTVIVPAYLVKQSLVNNNDCYNNDNPTNDIKNQISSILKTITKDKESTDTTKVSKVCHTISDEYPTICSSNATSVKVLNIKNYSNGIDNNKLTSDIKNKESSTLVYNQTFTNSTTPNESSNFTIAENLINKMPRPMIDIERTSVNRNEETNKTKKPSLHIQFIPVKQGTSSLTPVSQPVTSVPLLTPIISRGIGSVQAVSNLLKRNAEMINSKPLNHIKSPSNTSETSSVLTNYQRTTKLSNVIPMRTNQSPTSSPAPTATIKAPTIQQLQNTDQMKYLNMNSLNNNTSKSTNRFIPINFVQNDSKVKMLSVKELNIKGEVKNTHQTTIESNSFPNLPIRISLVKLDDKIHIKLNSSSSTEIKYSNLSNDQKKAVRNSLMQALQFDKRSKDLLTWLGLP